MRGPHACKRARPCTCKCSSAAGPASSRSMPGWSVSIHRSRRGAYRVSPASPLPLLLPLLPAPVGRLLGLGGTSSSLKSHESMVVSPA